MPVADPRSDRRRAFVPPGLVACPFRPSETEPIHGHRDFHCLSDEQLAPSGPHGDVLARLRYVAAPAGSLVLWRSDVIHANTNGHVEAVAMMPPHAAARAVQFVCWAPAALSSPRETAAKLAAAQRGHSNNHWPTFFTDGGASHPSFGTPSDPWRALVHDPLLPEQVAALGPPPPPPPSVPPAARVLAAASACGEEIECSMGDVSRPTGSAAAPRSPVRDRLLRMVRFRSHGNPSARATATRSKAHFASASAERR